MAPREADASGRVQPVGVGQRWAEPLAGMALSS